MADKILNTADRMEYDHGRIVGHPSLKQGVSLGALARQKSQCLAKFNSKGGRIMQVGTNSVQPFWRKGAVLGLLSHFP